LREWRRIWRGNQERSRFMEARKARNQAFITWNLAHLPVLENLASCASPSGRLLVLRMTSLWKRCGRRLATSAPTIHPQLCPTSTT